jgi:tetratricopeptide (TPR) repeat protein
MDVVMDDFGRAACLSYSGFAQEWAGQVELALKSFRDAQAVMSTIGMPGYACDALAGQARCYLKLGRIDSAIRYVRETYDYIHDAGGKGLEFPILAYLTCAKVYGTAANEERARESVEAGYDKLMQLSEKITDNKLRSSFLRNVPEHQEIISYWEKLHEI